MEQFDLPPPCVRNFIWNLNLAVGWRWLAALLGLACDLFTETPGGLVLIVTVSRPLVFSPGFSIIDVTGGELGWLLV